MKITRNQYREHELLKRARAKATDIPPGLHLTACLGCPRKAYYDLTDKLPPTDRMIAYNLIGNIIQDVFLDRNDNVLRLPVVDDEEGLEFPVLCMPDSEEEQAEFKTLRMPFKLPIREEYLMQCKVYCHLLDTRVYKVDNYYIAAYPAWKGMEKADYAPTGMRAPCPISYDVEFEQEEIDEAVEYVKDRAIEIMRAVTLPGNYDPPEKDEGGKSQWRCRDCQYDFRCMEV